MDYCLTLFENLFGHFMELNGRASKGEQYYAELGANTDANLTCTQSFGTFLVRYLTF